MTDQYRHRLSVSLPEAGETISEAGLRELFEETGLELRGSRLVVDTLGLWESVYPHLLSAGDPRRHHLVVYLHVVVPQPASKILGRLKVWRCMVVTCDVTFINLFVVVWFRLEV